LVDDHVIVDDPPDVIDVGLAERVKVGAGVTAPTVTVADELLDPPVPVHVTV